MISQIEKLDKLVNVLWEKINQEAIEYRKNILIPFCDEYKLAYGQGMGRFFFYDKEWYDSPYVYGVNCGPEFDEFLHLGNSSKLMKNSRFVGKKVEATLQNGEKIVGVVIYKPGLGSSVLDYVIGSWTFTTDGFYWTNRSPNEYNIIKIKSIDLNDMFVWYSSPQGNDYWDDIYIKLEENSDYKVPDEAIIQIQKWVIEFYRNKGGQ